MAGEETAATAAEIHREPLGEALGVKGAEDDVRAARAGGEGDLVGEGGPAFDLEGIVTLSEVKLRQAIEDRVELVLDGDIVRALAPEDLKGALQDDQLRTDGIGGGEPELVIAIAEIDLRDGGDREVVDAGDGGGAVDDELGVVVGAAEAPVIAGIVGHDEVIIPGAAIDGEAVGPRVVEDGDDTCRCQFGFQGLQDADKGGIFSHM